jgi:hypothetical protein
MTRSRALQIACGLALALSLPSYLAAQTPAGLAGFSKANLFGIWSKDRFADAVVVSGPAQDDLYVRYGGGGCDGWTYPSFRQFP